MRICGGPPSARVRGVQKGTVPMPKDMRTEKHHQTILPSSAGLTEQTPPAVFGTRLLLYQILQECQAFPQNSIGISVSAEAPFPALPPNGTLRASLPGRYPADALPAPCRCGSPQSGCRTGGGTAEGNRAPLHDQTILAVLIFTPGPMVEAATQLLIY